MVEISELDLEDVKRVDAEAASRICKALGNKNRLQVFLVIGVGGYPSQAAEFTGLSRQAVNQHLNRLLDAGLVGRGEERGYFLTVCGEEELERLFVEFWE